MGHTSKTGWLNTGEQTRRRTWEAVSVRVSCTGWTAKGGGGHEAAIYAVRSDRQFKELRLSQSEIDSVASSLADRLSDRARDEIILELVAGTSKETRAELLQTLLGQLKDGPLLTALATHLGKRKRLAKKKR